MRTVYYEDADFCLEYEVYENTTLILHCDVDDWNLSSFKKGLKVFGEMQNEFKDKGFIRFLTNSPNPKFCEVLGGKFVMEHEGNKVFTWELV